jgi:hypothetical protein
MSRATLRDHSSTSPSANCRGKAAAWIGLVLGAIVVLGMISLDTTPVDSVRRGRAALKHRAQLVKPPERGYWEAARRFSRLQPGCSPERGVYRGT